MLKAEKWETLTNELYSDNSFKGRTLLCRLVPYSNPAYGIKYNNNLELSIYNKYFIVVTAQMPIEIIRISVQQFLSKLFLGEAAETVVQTILRSTGR